MEEEKVNRNKPKINQLTKVDYIEDKDVIEEIEVENLIDNNYHDHQRLSSCIFKKVSFVGKFQECDFVDVIFDHCDLSNLDFSKQRFLRVEFIECKMSGIRFCDGLLEDVHFDQCLMPYSSFDQVRFKRTFFKECIMKETAFYDLSMKYCCFSRCALQKSEWMKVKSQKIDVSDSDIEGIRLDFDSLRDLVVNTFQAIELSTMLGIIIK